MTCDFAYESGRSPWMSRHEVRSFQNLNSRLDNYLVFLLTTDSEVESAKSFI